MAKTKYAVLQFALLAFVWSCGPPLQEKEQTQELIEFPASYQQTDTVSVLTEEQRSAFDALNMLQGSTDEKNRLYLTFANLGHCYPPDTSFVLSRSELLVVMKRFTTMHCTYLPVNVREELTATSVLAQKEYLVLHCREYATGEQYENGLPLFGRWVMPSILGRSDVNLIWSR